MLKRWFISLFIICGMVLSGCQGGGSASNGIYIPEENTSESIEYYGVGEWTSDLFSAPSREYNNDLALVAARMSERAEQGEENIKSYLRDELNMYGVEASYNDTEVFEIKVFGGAAFAFGLDTLTINGVDTTVLTIVCRGSTTLEEYAGDWFKGSKNGNVAGAEDFENNYDFYDKVMKGLNEYLTKIPGVAKSENLKVLVTGHSLGGAAANLVGADLTNACYEGSPIAPNLSQEDIYVYTFGAIKTLTTLENIEDGFENIHNIYNFHDSFGPRGNLNIFAASDENYKFGHTDLYDLDDESGMTSCDNHLMSNYIRGIEGGMVNCALISQVEYEDESQERNVAEVPQPVAPTPQAPAQSTGGFKLEGAWKSIGSYGFGQAQPGATVTFDGVHCNFYSPMDTYTFYNLGDGWKLDCKNVLWQDVLTFRVEIIDNNRIDIYYGSEPTQLQRI